MFLRFPHYSGFSLCHDVFETSEAIINFLILWYTWLYSSLEEYPWYWLRVTLKQRPANEITTESYIWQEDVKNVSHYFTWSIPCEVVKDLIEDRLKPQAPKYNYHHNNYYHSKPDILETKVDIVKDLVGDKFKPQFPKVNYNHNNYQPSKPDILETKIEITKDLIEEKMKPIEELPDGS